MTSKSGDSPAGRTFPEYFTQLAVNYSRSTGDSTYKVIEEFLRAAQPPVITTDSLINDNACGPGTATQAIITYLGAEPARIEATDSVPAMIDALGHRIESLGWNNVKPTLMDSHNLTFPDESFTTCISNISVTNYKDPPQCLQEMHRTLKPDGLAIVSIWKRFGAASLIHAAQKLVRADSKLMQIPKAELMQNGFLENMVANAGFKSVETRVVSVTCTGQEVEGLRSFILSDFTRTVREPWTEAEQAYWPKAVDRVIQEEVEQYGGVLFEAWVVVGRK